MFQYPATKYEDEKLANEHQEQRTNQQKNKEEKKNHSIK